jgi:hypothetical protein
LSRRQYSSHQVVVALLSSTHFFISLLVICRLLRLLDLLYLYPRAQTSRYLVAAPRVTINLSTSICSYGMPRCQPFGHAQKCMNPIMCASYLGARVSCRPTFFECRRISVR